jgi:hypothetical protein
MKEAKEEKFMLSCDLCGRNENWDEAHKHSWLVIQSPLGEIVETYCNVCRVIICPKGNCAD